MFAFQDAIDLWPDNHAAREGLQATRIAYAKSALEQENYALGLSLLNPADPEHLALHKELTEAQEQVNSREKRLKLARRAAIGATAATVVSLAVFAVVANSLTQEALHQKDIALKAQDAAELAQGKEVLARERAEGLLVVAENAKARADDEKKEADRQRGIAEASAFEALTQQVQAEYNAVVAEYEEGRARIAQVNEERQRRAAERQRRSAERNALTAQVASTAADAAAYDIENARENFRVLKEDYPQLLDWEASWLERLCDRGFCEGEIEGQVASAAYAPDGMTYASLTTSGDGVPQLVTARYRRGERNFKNDPVEAPLSVEAPSKVAIGAGRRGCRRRPEPADGAAVDHDRRLRRQNPEHLLNT